MNRDTNRHLSREVEDALREYLLKVESRLKAAGTDLAESRAILDDLEAQIRAQLLEQGPEPTWNDLTAILSQMDAPEKYGNALPARPARAGVKWVGLGVATLAVIVGLATVLKSKTGSAAAVAVLTESPAQIQDREVPAVPVESVLDELDEPMMADSALSKSLS